MRERATLARKATHSTRTARLRCAAAPDTTCTGPRPASGAGASSVTPATRAAAAARTAGRGLSPGACEARPTDPVIAAWVVEKVVVIGVRTAAAARKDARRAKAGDGEPTEDS